MKPLSALRFDALAGYSRSPYISLSARELEYYEEGDEKLLGVVSLDIQDHDFVFTVLGRDAMGRFRAVDLEHTIGSADEARNRLAASLAELVLLPDSDFHQGDEVGEPLDFFAPMVPPERLSPTFRTLTEQVGYTPALGLLKELMHYFQGSCL